MQLRRKVDDVVGVGQGHEQAAGAFHDQQPVRRRCLQLSHVDGDAGAPRRLMRRDRLGQYIGLGQDAIGGDSGKPAHGNGVGLRLRPCLHRLPIESVEMGEEPGGDDGLADIGVGACDEKALQSS